MVSAMRRPWVFLLFAAILAPAHALSERDRTQVLILQENVERAFLTNYLGKNHSKIRPAPGKIRALSVRLLQGSGIALKIRARLYVLEDPLVQASTSPGGTIFLYRGILDLGLSDAEVAALLSHEIAHIVHAHWLERLKRGVNAQLLAQYAAKKYGKGSAQATYLYHTIKNLEYNRAEEEQADATAVRLLADAGYPPRALADLLGKVSVRQAKEQAENPQAMAHLQAPAYLQTHPLLPERIAKVEALASSAYGRRREKRLR